MDKIRIGIFGLKRGKVFFNHSDILGTEIVAVCDRNEQLLGHFKENGATGYTDFDLFLQHDMDAVVLANHFHEHAPYAIKVLQSGKHVMSETSACKTMQEGVQLARAVENSEKIYMFAENYPYMAFGQEMRRLYLDGEIGEVMYGEGDYNHPFPVDKEYELSTHLYHWRNFIPSTYYCTHALGPLMYMTDTMPRSVNAHSIAHPNPNPMSVRRTDPGSVILCRMDNGAVFRILGKNMSGHALRYRLHGTNGMMETTQTDKGRCVRIQHEPWEHKQGRTVVPQFPSHAESAKLATHGGGDFWTMYHFVEAIRSGEQPYLNVYRALAMTVVGIAAWKSALLDGQPVEVPDFSNKSSREQYEQDDWSPFFEDRKPGQPSASIRGEMKPSAEAIERAQEVWKQMGNDPVIYDIK